MRDNPEKDSGVNSGKILDERDLGFGKSRAKRKPERFRPRPNPTNRPKKFLIARPKTTFKSLTSLHHVRNIENLKFEFELGDGFLPSDSNDRSLTNGSEGRDSKAKQPTAELRTCSA